MTFFFVDLVEIVFSENKGNEIDVKPHENFRRTSQLFSVRYMNWSKYHWHPRAYIESVFDALDNKRFLIQYRIPGKHR